MDEGTQGGRKEDAFTKAPRKTLSPRMCCVCAQFLQSCPSCCDPARLCSLPGSSVHGILQARILERVTVHLTGTPEDWGWFLLHVGNAVSKTWVTPGCDRRWAGTSSHPWTLFLLQRSARFVFCCSSQNALWQEGLCQTSDTLLCILSLVLLSYPLALCENEKEGI